MSPRRVLRYAQGIQGRLALVGYLVLATGVVVALYFVMVGQNDLQRSRVSSCRQTYEGIRQVLKPFFPPPPRTKAQQHQLDKFNRTVNRFKGQCAQQTSTKEQR